MPRSDATLTETTSPYAVTNRTTRDAASIEALIASLQAVVAGSAHAPREHCTLAILFLQRGELEQAELHFKTTLEQDAHWTDAHEGLGTLAIRHGDFAAARPHFLRVIQLAPDNLSSRFALYDIEQALGNSIAALEHQQEILARQRLFTIRAPHEQRNLLVLLGPGDWKANVPVDFLIDFSTTTTHKLYLLDNLDQPQIPKADLIFCAIGESDQAAGILAQAERLVTNLAIPVINAPSKILKTSRTEIVQALADIDEIVTAPTVRVPSDTLISEVSQRNDELLVRPTSSHAGQGLERFIAGPGRPEALQSYRDRVPSDNYYVTPFIDYKSDDGFYRKYRMICVDGEPYPFHLAISPNWMIHYYNAPMRDHLWMREEEQRFLADSLGTMGTTAYTALRAIAARTGLEYIGVDCSVLPDGRLLVFEADPAMIVHHLGADGVFGYHVPYARAIYAAFERLMDRIRARS